jgi:hypothetical protein
MAKFAEIKQVPDEFDPSKNVWRVQRVVTVCNSIVSHNGDVAGEEWCKNFFKGGTWKQTSYNTRNGIYYTPDENSHIKIQDPDQTKAFRHNYAGINYVYDFEHDVFYYKQPYASWTLNTTNYQWEAPIPTPTIKKYINSENNEIQHNITWDETNQKWLSTCMENRNWEWNTSTSQWDEIL